MARHGEGVLEDESHDELGPDSSDIDAGACEPYCGSGQAPFIAYEAIRDALVERGIPRHEIAFIQQARGKQQREQLMAAVRSGAVRVLLAGSQNTGLNVQERLIAVHNADVPWRPGDLEQRIGRAQRQGNAWTEIYVCNYAVEGSFDSYIWVRRAASFLIV
jgi:ATP-dependent helicase YprA (DUF1998 family)